MVFLDVISASHFFCQMNAKNLNFLFILLYVIPYFHTWYCHDFSFLLIFTFSFETQPHYVAAMAIHIYVLTKTCSAQIVWNILRRNGPPLLLQVTSKHSFVINSFQNPHHCIFPSLSSTLKFLKQLGFKFHLSFTLDYEVFPIVRICI